MVACRYGIINKLTLFFSGQLQPHSGFTATYANPGTLKEQCHEEFAVLGQFWAKIITFSLNHKQNASVKLRGRSQMNFITEG